MVKGFDGAAFAAAKRAIKKTKDFMT